MSSKAAGPHQALVRCPLQFPAMHSPQQLHQGSGVLQREADWVVGVDFPARDEKEEGEGVADGVVSLCRRDKRFSRRRPLLLARVLPPRHAWPYRDP